MRALGWAWMVVLAVASLLGDLDTRQRTIVVAGIVLATAGAGATFLAARRGFLASPWYVTLDGLIALSLGAAAWFAGIDEFLVGGYPASFIFIVAYASNMRVTAAVGVAAGAVFAVLHAAMGLDQIRVLGSVQFVVVAVVVGWAFDTLRERDRMRLDAERAREESQRELAAEQERVGRLEERSGMARRLHDSVLQTLKLIRAAADDPGEVRYLARVQERDLRKTINEYESPYADSFRARIMDAGAEIEDRYRVEIEQVIKDDAPMDERLEAVVAAAAEALNNAARHSGTKTIDLFAEIHDEVARVNVRDRGQGFDIESGGDGLERSLLGRVASAGGTVDIRSTPGRGTEVEIEMPLR